MQYILTEQEYNDLKQFEQKYKELQNDLNRVKEEAYNLGYKNGLVQLPLDSLKKLISNSNGSPKLIDKNWVWSPVDGKHYFNESNILDDFRKQLEYDINKVCKR